MPEQIIRNMLETHEKWSQQKEIQGQKKNQVEILELKNTTEIKKKNKKPEWMDEISRMKGTEEKIVNCVMEQWRLLSLHCREKTDGKK